MNECKFCLENIDIIVKYKLSETDDLKDFVYCFECLNTLQNNKWYNYITNLKNVDCEKSLLSLIKDGPPINFRDTYIEDNKEIYEFYYNEKIYSAKLNGSLNNYENKELHNKLINISKNLKNEINYDYLSDINKVLSEFSL